MMPCLQAGILTRQNTHALDLPSVRPASARLWSKLSNAPRAVRYMSGKLTTTVAKIAEYHVMVSLTPKTPITQAPMGRLGPRSTSRR